MILRQPTLEPQTILELQPRHSIDMGLTLMFMGVV